MLNCYLERVIRIKYCVIGLILLSFNFKILSQVKYDYNWVLDGKIINNIDTFYFEGYIMKFLDNKISFKSQLRNFEFETNANSFSDKLGNLKYMSNGCLIVDQDAKPIKNGDSITFGEKKMIFPNFLFIRRNGLFIPNVFNDSLTYYIHNQFDTARGGIYKPRMLICTIDNKKDSIVELNRTLTHDTLIWSALTGIKGKDSVFYWIINPRYGSNHYITIGLNESGQIIKKIINEGGMKIDHAFDNTSQATFSPDGKKYAIMSSMKGLQLFDFDRATGELSNSRSFFMEDNTVDHSAGGCAFSPNSRFLYISMPEILMQIDLTEVDSNKIIDTVGVCSINDDIFPRKNHFYNMTLGPDCRIYLSSSTNYSYLIKYPDRKGSACEFVQQGLKLPSNYFIGLPNNPHYRVDEAWPCDSTIKLDLGTSNGYDSNNKPTFGSIFIYPQPACDYLCVLPSNDLISTSYQIKIFDIAGTEIVTQDLLNVDKEMRLNISTLLAGVYILKIRSDDRYWQEKFIVRY